MADVSLFGARLRELRVAKGWTQPQLAERAGMTKDGVAQLEQGKRYPTWETVLDLAAALSVTPNDFTIEPATREPPGPGRPPKVEVEVEATAQESKKPLKRVVAGKGKKGK